MTAKLTSATVRAMLARATKVKPLVWFEAELPSRGGGKYTAEGYTVRRIEGVWLLDFAGQSRSDWRFGSADLAKAAAQADYDARIRAALEPDPERLATVRNLIDAAGAVIHDHNHGNGLEGHYANKDRLDAALIAMKGGAA